MGGDLSYSVSVLHLHGSTFDFLIYLEWEHLELSKIVQISSLRSLVGAEWWWRMSLIPPEK